METLQFSPSPYSFNALALLFIGLTGIVYLLRLRGKTTAIRYMILVVGGFTLGMVSWLATSIVFWGGALLPLTDACAAISTASTILFAYHYPQKVRSLEATLFRIFALLVILVAIFSSLAYAVQYFIRQGVETWQLPSAFWMLNPAAALLALLVSLRRMLTLQVEGQSGGARIAFTAFWKPRNRTVRLLRNFSLALFCGMLQGVVSFLGSVISFPDNLAPLLINLSLFLTLVVVVYSVFDLTEKQPRLVVRLLGLSLVSVLGLAGIIGTYTYRMAANLILAQAKADLAAAQLSLAEGNAGVVPENVAYIVSDSFNSSAQHVLFARPDVDAQALLDESLGSGADLIWNYNFEITRFCPGGLAETQNRFGSYPSGTLYQYIGCRVLVKDKTYEIGFSYADLDRTILDQTAWVWKLILAGGALVMLVFPSFYRSNLIRPLDRLLDGVRRVDSGNLDIQIPVTYQDEVGFLTSSFNKMSVTLKDELVQRERAEAELRQLNLTLEQRVADRTRELEALYEVTAAASQAQDSISLLDVLLERSMAALNCPTGLVLLIDENSPTADLRLFAHRGFPAGWLTYWMFPETRDPLLSAALAQRDPLLIANLTGDSRAPDFMQAGEPLTLILAPLMADGQRLGLMGLARDAGHGFDLNEAALLVSIVGQVGVALHTDRLRQMAQRATVLQERQRLSRDLHDSVTQSLYGLVSLSEAARVRMERGDIEAGSHLLTRVGQTARQAIREMRLFLHQLRPSVLEQEGLVNALELRLAAVEGRSDVQACLEADETIQLPQRVETAFYYIAQEALNNSLKHASAATVIVRLQRAGNGVRLEVEDDGCGFDSQGVDSGGMGLENMKVRADGIHAHLEVLSSPGNGTRVRVTVEELA